MENAMKVLPRLIEIHPAANKVRMMDTTEYGTLFNDIRDNGQLVPAVLLDGMLIDGRNRQKACLELGIELLVEEHKDVVPDPIRLVWSYNAARRNLTKGQKAALASDMANVKNAGGNQYSGLEVGSSKKTTQKTDPKPVTQQEAAETFGVDSSQLRKFRAVEAKEPETAKNIREGNASVESSYNDMKKRTQTEPTVKVASVTPITPETVTTPVEWAEVAELSGISTDNLTAALSDHAHPQYMVARRLEANRERLCKELSPLSKAERKRAMKAVLSVLVHEQEVFDAEVRAVLPKYNKALEVKLKKEIEAQKKIKAELRKKVGADFDKADFKFIRGVLHSDREVNPERRNKAFDLFMKLNPLFS